MGALLRPTAAAAVVAACAVIAWLPALDAGFVSDDFTMLSTAESVESPFWPFARNDLGQPDDGGHFYRPLWVLWTGGLSEAFGERAEGFHAGNLLLFVVICLELLLIARRLLPAAGALVAAAVFALYPRHGESVAWISGSTDLLATALGLGALLCLVWPGPKARLIAAAAVLTATAALTKEAAFLLPLLALVLARARAWDPGAALGRRGLAAAAAMTVALALVLAVRTVVIGSLGGYSDEPVTALRTAAAAVSYVVASVSPSQLQLLRQPLLLLVPVGLALALAYGLWRLPRGESEGRLQVALAGLAWFAIALVPVLGLPLDLNSANGERLLMLPSVGLALAIGALVPPRPNRAGLAAVVVTALALLALSLDTARNWVRAGEIANRVTESAAALAPRDGRLILLSVPDSYRSARVFTNSFEVALRRAGREDVEAAGCTRVQIREEGAGNVVFRPDSSRRGFHGTAMWSAPFDFPVVGEPSPFTPLCAYEKLPSPETAPGLRLTALARPAPSSRRSVLAYFDGEDLVRCCPGG